jgi:transcriptional regulator with XRE-family HTH domain
LFFIWNIGIMFDMKNIAIRTTRALGAAVKARRLELGWSQAKLADHLRVQRQWVIRLEAGSDGAEIGTVLKALLALGLSIVIGNEPSDARKQAAPAANLDDVFARLTARDPRPSGGSTDEPPGKKPGGKRR